MGDTGQNTNLASEYYVLSILYRMNVNAYLTLGNKKSIDIVIDKNGETLTADVKGLRGTSNFPIDNWNRKHKNHFLIFISFLNKINDLKCLPEVYIVPSTELENEHKELGEKSIIYRNPKGNRTVVELSRLRKLKNKYRDKWDYFFDKKES
ncbi:MAG: hypothetical protein HYW26_01415 [Candidatus Aenigmarchaeota archaeon]|nr:hypothetical protein [Candidatus Aenigmarchaeota archaeon]